MEPAREYCGSMVDEKNRIDYPAIERPFPSFRFHINTGPVHLIPRYACRLGFSLVTQLNHFVRFRILIILKLFYKRELVVHEIDFFPSFLSFSLRASSPPVGTSKTPKITTTAPGSSPSTDDGRGRTRSRVGVSQSQPGSRSGSPGSTNAYLTYGFSMDPSSPAKVRS